MNRGGFFLGLLFTAIACSAAAPAEARRAAVCEFPTPARVLVDTGKDGHEKGAKRLEVYEIPNAPIWWSRTPPHGPYLSLRHELETKAGETRPIALLQKIPSRNNRLVIESASKWIRPVNCLEMLLAGEQHDRVPALERPTEFFAIVLESADGRWLRVYNYTVNEDGIGRATPISDLAVHDHLKGWRVLGTLHNHGFHPDAPAGNAPLAPSVPDAGFYLNFAAQVGEAHAWITNGLDTVDIPPSAFPDFEH